MTNLKYARKCDECNKGMNSGFVIDGGSEYFCSDECLHKHYTEAEWKLMYGEGETESYWTEWEDDDDFQFEEVDGELVEIDESDDDE